MAERLSFSTGSSPEDSRKNDGKKEGSSASTTSSKTTLPKRESLAQGRPEAAVSRSPFDRLFEGLVPKPAAEKVEKPELGEGADDKKTAESAEATADTAEKTPEDQLTPEETATAVERLSEARTQEIQAEKTSVSPETTEAEAADLAAVYHEHLQEQVAAGVSADEAMTAAYAATTGEDAPELPETIDEDMTAAEESDEGDAAIASSEQFDALPQDRDDPDAEQTSAGFGAAYTGGGTAARSGRYGGTAGVPAGGTPNHPFGRRVDRSGEGGAFLAGGLIGLIVGEIHGRRRGRAKAAEQLLPVQRKLEKQVKTLYGTLAAREAQVRRFAWERAEQQHERTLQASQQSAESRPFTVRPETAKPIPSVERLSLDEVLKISETITVGTTTMRNVYETNLISERGLRRIIQEHIHGGNTRRVLTEELLIKEISHELDPILRDRPPESGRSASVAGSSTSAMQDTTAVAGIASAPSGSSPEPSPTQSQPSAPAPSTLLIANIIALLTLGILIVILIIIWLTR